MSAQDIRGQPNLVGVDKEELTTTAHRCHQVGDNAAGLGAGAGAQIIFCAIELVRIGRRGGATAQQGNRTFDLLAVELLHHRINARRLGIAAIGEEPEIAGPLADQCAFHRLQAINIAAAVEIEAAGGGQAVDGRGDAVGVELVFKDFLVDIAFVIL